MKRKNWRWWLLTIHRDGGYFCAGLIIVYCLSGIALNHRHDWDPSFVIERKTIPVSLPAERDTIDKTWVENLLRSAGIHDIYRTHDFPSRNKMKIFLGEGTVLVDAVDGVGHYETLRRRPLFYQVNLLHLNPHRAWTFFSDAFSLALIVIVLSGMFLARGRFGFRWRGAVLTFLGCLPPLGFLIALA